jgi:hypothetical protein
MMPEVSMIRDGMIYIGDSFDGGYHRMKVKVETPGYPDVWASDGEIAELIQLVRWLARTYGDNEPVFGDTDEMKALQETYWRCIGRRGMEDRPKLIWVQCVCCHAWSTQAMEVIDV